MFGLWPDDKRPATAVSWLNDSEESVDDVVDLGCDSVIAALQVASCGLLSILEVLNNVVQDVVGVASKAFKVMLDLAVGARGLVAGLGGGVGKL